MTANAHHMADGRPWRAEHLFDRIATTYPPPEWAVFAEVADATGARQRRWADAVAMNLYPSRGLELRGFEIKVDRRDLARELATPEKAEAVAAYCNTWWLVTPPGLVEDSAALPLAWGLLEAEGDDGLRVAKAAQGTPAREPTRGFLAAMLRAAHKQVAAVRKHYVHRDDIAAELAQAEERGKADLPRLIEHERREHAELRRVLDEFQAKTAIPLIPGDAWHRTDVDRIARAYRIGSALEGRHGRDLRWLREALDRTSKALEIVRENADPLLAAEAAAKEVL